MTLYVQAAGSDVWHWCKNCPQYPSNPAKKQELPAGQRPSNGELDNQCRRLEDDGNCQS